MSTNRHEASALRASWAWAPMVLGAVVALLGVILATGGVYLAMLGGSLYYAIVGVTLGTSNLDQTAKVLRTAGVSFSCKQENLILAPAYASGAMIEFVPV